MAEMGEDCSCAECQEEGRTAAYYVALRKRYDQADRKRRAHYQKLKRVQAANRSLTQRLKKAEKSEANWRAAANARQQMVNDHDYGWAARLKQAELVAEKVRDLALSREAALNVELEKARNEAGRLTGALTRAEMDLEERTCVHCADHKEEASVLLGQYVKLRSKIYALLDADADGVDQ